jgi:hypothetical protein
MAAAMFFNIDRRPPSLRSSQSRGIQLLRGPRRLSSNHLLVRSHDLNSHDHRRAATPGALATGLQAASASARHVGWVGGAREERLADTVSLSPVTTPTLSPTHVDPVLDQGDHERMAHIVLEGYTPEDGEFVSTGTNVVEGMVTGTPVKALCGKVWVPGRDPQRFPICPTCKEIAAAQGWKLPSR